MAGFFTSLLPQFGTTLAKLRLGRVYRAIQAVTGAVLIALGVRLATTPD